MNDNNLPSRKQAEDFLSITDLWYLCLAHWYWFVLSLGLCLSVAIYYLKTTPKMYSRMATIMVKQEASGKNTQSYDVFSDIGLVQQNSNLNNVVRHISSLDILMEVARRRYYKSKINSNMQADSIPSQTIILKQAQGIQGRLKAKIDDDKSTIINLEYLDTSTERAEFILYNIIDVYNEKWVSGKNQLTDNTSRFIQDRLSLIEADLDNVDDSISTFKSQNKITDINRISDLYLQQQSQSEAEILRLSNRRAMAQYIREMLADSRNHYELLPSNSGIDNQVAEAQISQYNTALQQLKTHLEYTSRQNPLIIRQEAELSDLRNNILHTIDNQIQSIDIQLETMEGYSGSRSSMISSNPDQAKHLVSVERQQKVKESLYLYLLQKREENEISMAYTSENIQVIEIPHGSDAPTSPNRRNILFAAILLGLLVPTVIVFVKANLNSTVRDKFDIVDQTSLPLIGEIPFYGKRSIYSNWKFWKPKPRNTTKVVVSADNKDMVNEAFRVLRSNLAFLNSDSINKGNVYIVTSNVPSSGKTFVSMNLAITLALAKNRVLFIDGDLRRATASRYWAKHRDGLSDYLSGRTNDVEANFVILPEYPTLSILPVGAIPPNPTELLITNRLGQLIEYCRPKYDYIIIDCPPDDNIADTHIIEKHADRTLFVVRVGLFQRKDLTSLAANVERGEYKNLSLVLNGVTTTGMYGYRYAYRYGYNYDYRYN